MGIKVFLALLNSVKNLCRLNGTKRAKRVQNRGFVHTTLFVITPTNQLVHTLAGWYTQLLHI